MDIGETEEAAVDLVGVEEGDMDVGKKQKLGQLKHTVDVALSWKRKDQNMGFIFTLISSSRHV